MFIGRTLMSLATGLVVTPLLEYAWHAWVAHGKVAHASRDEHLDHHKTANTVRDPWEEMGANAGRIGGSLAVLNITLAPFVGLRTTLPLSVGLVAGYAATTLYHAQMHQRGPRTAYERWMWRFHWHHHAADARVNFGLTNPLCDFVFGTAVVPDEVEIPERLVPEWLRVPHAGFRRRAAQTAS